MKLRNVLRIALAACTALGIGLVLHYREFLSGDALRAELEHLGAWAPLAFLALWLIGPVLLVPGAPLTLAAGALFGPLLGTLYSLVGATAGATAAFLLARYLGGEWARRRVKGRLAEVKAGVEAEGWRFVAFVRLVPLFPFNLLNYALGLTRIRLSEYVWTTLFSMIPGAAGYAYLGYAGREALLGAEGWVRKGGLALGVLAALILLPLMLRHWRRARAVTPRTLAGWLREGKDLCVLDVRSAQEFQGPEGRIEPSLNIPVDELRQRLVELEPHRSRPMVVV